MCTLLRGLWGFLPSFRVPGWFNGCRFWEGVACLMQSMSGRVAWLCWKSVAGRLRSHVDVGILPSFSMHIHNPDSQLMFAVIHAQQSSLEIRILMCVFCALHLLEAVCSAFLRASNADSYWESRALCVCSLVMIIFHELVCLHLRVRESVLQCFSLAGNCFLCMLMCSSWRFPPRIPTVNLSNLRNNYFMIWKFVHHHAQL